LSLFVSPVVQSAFGRDPKGADGRQRLRSGFVQRVTAVALPAPVVVALAEVFVTFVDDR
jgi:hypothetical protein